MKPKEEINGTGSVKVTRLRSIENEDYDSKKSNPLEPEFTNPKDDKKSEDDKKKPDEEYPPVAFFKLFKYSTRSDKCLLFIGVVAGIVCALSTPANTLLIGNLTGSMVDYGMLLLLPNVTEEVLHAAAEKFLDDITDYAVNNTIIGVVVLVATYISIVTFNYTAHRQVFRIRTLFLQSALHQDISWFDLNNTGDFASRMAEDINKLADGIGEKVVMVLTFVTTFFASIILAFVKGWLFTFVCLISLPVTFISVGIVGMITSRLAKKELEVYGKAGSIAEEVLSSIRTVVAFGGESKEVQRYESNLGAARSNNTKRGFFSGVGFGLLWFFIYASYALSFWYGVGLILDGSYDVPQMVTVFFSVMMGSMNIGISSPYFETFAIAKGAGAKVFAIIKRVAPINSMSTEGLQPDSVNGVITFKNVHFQYPSRADVKVLQGLNLTIQAGETVALVGNSGCGKSTCVQLIQRFYDPQEGHVFLDGNDVKDLNVSWLRAHIGVVGQEPILFQTSIADNIRYGNESATRDEIMQAAKEANAHDFIVRLPMGYDTIVGERGAQLSGGQKQRVAIARALVRKPRILLLDEATSALDMASEAKVQSALDKASKGRTTIIIAHRLSTIRGANKIVVISAGEVVEEGTHEDLMAKKGHYHALVMAQVSSNEEFEDDNNEKPKLGRMLSVVSNNSSLGEDSFSQLSGLGNLQKVEETSEEESENIGMIEVLKENKPEWVYITIGCICSGIMGAAMPIFAVLFGSIMEILGLTDPDAVRSETNMYCVYFVITGVVVGLSTFTQIWSYTIAGERFTMRLRRQLFEAMIHQEIAWFDDKSNNTGALCAKLSGDTSSVQGATGQRLGTIFQSITTFALGIGLSMYYDWRLGLVTLSFTPIILGAGYFFGRMMRGRKFGNQNSLEKATKLAVEAVSNIRTVASLGRESSFLQDYIKELLPFHSVELKDTHIRSAIFSIARAIPFFAYATSMYYGGKLVYDGEMSYGDVYKVSNALIIGTNSIANALAFAPNFEKGMKAAARIFQLVRRKPKIMDPVPFSNEKWVADGNVNYMNVEFSYPTRQNSKVLRGLNVNIKQGQTVALVGASGCGKSTCIQLLERFYDPTSGIIALDGRDISSVTLHSLRSQLGIVSQEPVLFDRTIAENIAYGDNAREVQMDEIIEAAKHANIHNFITSLPLGYETRLGEKGTQLSGGQKQRVAIARALVRNPRVLLLDEATSALDTESERIVQEALDKAKEGRTCIIIAHRLSTIHDADVICVIDKGKVAELGTHSQLLSQKGAYYKLHRINGGNI